MTILKKLLAFILVVVSLSLNNTHLAECIENGEKHQNTVDKDTINIAMVSDTNYLFPTIVSMVSILENKSQETTVHFYLLLSEDVADKDKQKILSLQDRYTKCKINLISVKNKYTSIKTNRKNFTTAYFKLQLPSILSNLDKVLYIDSDTLVMQDLSELYYTNIDNYYIAGVKDYFLIGKRPEYGKKIGLPTTDQYVNSGIILMNLENMRKNDVEKMFSQYVVKNHCSNKRIGSFHDQDVFNYVCYGNIKFIPVKYNVLLRYKDDSYAFLNSIKISYGKEKWTYEVNNPVIMHFTGLPIRPWQLPDDDSIWWDYARKTPYYTDIKNKYPEKVIVSLTSYPAKYCVLPYALKSLANQSVKPDKIILNLCTLENSEQDKKHIYDMLKENNLQDVVTINWINEKIGPYGKLIPTLKMYPNDVIIVVDDDQEYYPDLVKNLIEKHRQFPNCIITNIASPLYDDYSRNVSCQDKRFAKNKSLNSALFYGVWGFLCPPHCFSDKVFDQKLYMTEFPTTDDIWFSFCAMVNRTKIVRLFDGKEVQRHVCTNAINKYKFKNLPGLYTVNKDSSGEKNNIKNLAKIRKMFEEMNIKVDYMKAKADAVDSVPAVASDKKSVVRNYDFYKNLDPSQYEVELKDWFQRKTGKELNLDEPKTFNEKIQWLKLYDSTPIKTTLADKYLVREWVKEKIGEEYLIPLLGVWEKFDDIDFDKLPDKFVLKCNHGSGWNMVVTDKSKFNKAEAKKKFDTWISTNFAFRNGFELHYKNIEPKIIAEEYVENSNSDLYDYKVWCFNGTPENVLFVSNRKKRAQKILFDTEWRHCSFYGSSGKNSNIPDKPNELNKLLKLAENLSKDFPFVRVDFYILNDGSIKFSELTFTPASGNGKWNDEKYNKILGEKIVLPKEKYDYRKLFESSATIGTTNTELTRAINVNLLPPHEFVSTSKAKPVAKKAINKAASKRIMKKLYFRKVAA